MVRWALIVLPLLVIGMAAGVSSVTHQALTYRVQLQEPVVLTVKRGSTFRQIAKDLSQRNLIIYPEIIEFYMRIRGYSNDLQAGEYEFSGNLSTLDILANLRKGAVTQHSVILIEGETLKLWLQRLQRHPKIKHTLSPDNQQPLRDAIGEQRENLEGLFFSDTYRFRTGDSDLDVLKRAYAAMGKHLNEVWASRAEGLPYEDPYALLTMASIVEKETGVPEERPRIAGVFVSRLRKRMRLQTDPTVIYGIGDAFDGNIRMVHLRTDTPYNTYTRRGLPPTPIAMVGRAALEAAAHPNITGELFFVSRGDGTHVFSKTLQAHNAAVRKYQLKR
jgi:UPF0755 protein